MTDELNETTKLAMKLHEEKSSHQLAVELAELQRKYQIALGAIDRLQDQRDEAVAKAKALAVPEGWQMAPRIPTPEMCAAFRKSDSDWQDGWAWDDNGNRHESPVYQWIAMLDATPKHGAIK